MEDIEQAIERTSRSAPGPDGIPYFAWRRLGPLATRVLHGVSELLESSEGLAALGEACPLNAEGHSAFNEAIMVFLSKKDPLISNSGVSYTRAEDLRPLSIVNTDNSLLANALRLRIEPILEQAISNMQQDFLAGRSMLKTVIDVDSSMREAALNADDPAAVFHDFQAAFASLSHSFLLKSLQGLGLPATVCRFMECLYWGHGCRLSACGQQHPVFKISAGIRQGCPLSPLLFAVVVDSLLRRLRRMLPSATVRAYADDLVTVLENLSWALPCLVQIFAEFAAASGLRLNFRKVVVVPLGDSPPDVVTQQISATFPTWGLVQCRQWAKYLGFALGPGRAEHSWDAALEKAVARARLWSRLALGLQYAAFVYKVYVASTLSFLLQLEPLPVRWASVETQILRILVPGPCHWCRPDELHGLRRDFGFPCEFTDLRVVSLAAKFRVAHVEARAQGGLCHRAWLQRLAAAEHAADRVYRRARWSDWFAGSYCHNLAAAVENFRRQGVAISAVLERAVGTAACPWTQAQTRRATTGIQRAACALLQERCRRCPETRMRAKLERWEVLLFPRVRAQRALAMLRRVARLAAPRRGWQPQCFARYGQAGAQLAVSAVALLASSVAWKAGTPWSTRPSARRLRARVRRSCDSRTAGRKSNVACPSCCSTSRRSSPMKVFCWAPSTWRRRTGSTVNSDVIHRPCGAEMRCDGHWSRQLKSWCKATAQPCR
ncbi:unnamed protein product [Prorocentrum cordatum]|uniref:Reverse transcriptase domain-containing protein n=1 Tax=Prorocentrum cordatum TaxID=2364126 RepID=A0ABN9YDM7_9DINO|nr:unnamed protein product [Polarella glacialis]